MCRRWGGPFFVQQIFHSFTIAACHLIAISAYWIESYHLISLFMFECAREYSSAYSPITIWTHNLTACVCVCSFFSLLTYLAPSNVRDKELVGSFCSVESLVMRLYTRVFFCSTISSAECYQKFWHCFKCFLNSECFFFLLPKFNKNIAMVNIYSLILPKKNFMHYITRLDINNCAAKSSVIMKHPEFYMNAAIYS